MIFITLFVVRWWDFFPSYYRCLKILMMMMMMMAVMVVVVMMVVILKVWHLPPNIVS